MRAYPRAGPLLRRSVFVTGTGDATALLQILLVQPRGFGTRLSVLKFPVGWGG